MNGLSSPGNQSGTTGDGRGDHMNTIGASQPQTHPHSYHAQYAGQPRVTSQPTHLHPPSHAQTRAPQYHYVQEPHSHSHPYSFPSVTVSTPSHSALPRLTTPTSGPKMSGPKGDPAPVSTTTPVQSSSTTKGKNKDRDKSKGGPKQTPMRHLDPPSAERDDLDELLDPTQDRERDKGRERAQQKARRTWKACETCRKRKIKCDGGYPCGFCETNDKVCDYKTVTDNAATHRAQAAAVSDRLIRMEEMLERLLPLVDMVEALGGDPSLTSRFKREKRQSSLGSPQLHSIEGNEPGRVKSDPTSQEAGRKVVKGSTGHVGTMGNGMASDTSIPNGEKTDEMKDMDSDQWDHLPLVGGDVLDTGVQRFDGLPNLHGHDHAMEHYSRDFITSEARTSSNPAAQRPPELLPGAPSSSPAMATTNSGQFGWNVPKLDQTLAHNDGRVDPHLSHTAPALSDSIMLHPPPDQSSEMMMSDDIFPPIPPSLSTGTAGGGSVPAMGISGSYSNNPTRERGTDVVRLSTGYGPKDESANLKVFGNSDENEGKAGPVSWQDRLSGRLAQDSRGHMKFHGGPATFLFSDAIEALRSPIERANSPTKRDTLQSHVGGTRKSSMTSTLQDGPIDLDELYFKPWAQFRSLRGLPPPDQARFPHSRICDFLVKTYFNRLHPLFPIIDRASFLQKYDETMAMRANGAFAADSTFLCLLFAVFTATAQVVRNHMREKEGLNWSLQTVGLEVYEQTLYLLWYHTGELTIEHVSSYCLLASTMAGWNSLSQAWIFAGQAVRAAQDLGLHRSPERLRLSSQGKDHRRLVWWCAYGLDRALSISMGRPMACSDADLDVEYPLQLKSNHEPNVWDDPALAEDQDSMTAFLELTRVYTLAGEVEHSAHSLQSIKGYDDPAQAHKLRQNVTKLDSKMDFWVKNLPDCVRLAQNTPSSSGVFLLAMLGRITLFAATINLHRPFIPEEITHGQDTTSLMKCISAAKGCIYAGGQIKEIIPASHHCQFLVHYLTISAAILLRCTSWVTDLELATDMIIEAEKCYNILLDLETTWRGAEKSAYIVHKLLRLCKARLAEQQQARTAKPNKRNRESAHLEGDHVHKRSRHSPPVEGLPAPVFDTIPSRINYSSSSGFTNVPEAVPQQMQHDVPFYPPLNDINYADMMGQQNLSELLDGFLVETAGGRQPVGLNMSLPGSSAQLDHNSRQIQQNAFRKALHEPTFLYEF